MKRIIFQYQDLAYKAFHEKLIPNIAPDRIIGVRTPVLRKIAKDFRESVEREKFMEKLPHRYYEENNLHHFFIRQITDFDDCIKEIERFLPYVDNWATCDSMRFDCFRKNTDRLIPYIEKWLKSSHTYTVRFAIEMLMVYFLDDKFDVRYLQIVASVKSDEYYVNMMIAWYFATALAKKWDAALLYITEKRLPPWVHNKTIQKAAESYRISPSQKEFLKKQKLTVKEI